MVEGFDGGSVVLEEPLARSWLEQASQLPGWNEGPEFAPHPIAVATVNDDEGF